MSDKQFYTRQRQGGIGSMLEQAGESSDGSTFSLPSVEQGELKFKLLVINSEDISKRCYLSLYNSRCYERLTNASVNDILPDIQVKKRNAIPAIGAIVGDKIEVLAGGRRMYSVSTLPDGQFYILVAEGISEPDKKFLSNTSDTYDKPSILDVGFKVLAIQKSHEKVEGQGGYRAIADMLGISLGKAQESATFARYPNYIIDGFPALRFISYQFLRQINKYKEQFPEKENKIKALYQGEYAFNETMEPQQYSKSLQSKILQIFKPKPLPSKTIEDWKNRVHNKSVSVTGSENELILKVDLTSVDPSVLKQIEKIFAKKVK
jgi:ParB family chromosome partitioning protein